MPAFSNSHTRVPAFVTASCPHPFSRTKTWFCLYVYLTGLADDGVYGHETAVHSDVRGNSSIKSSFKISDIRNRGCFSFFVFNAWFVLQPDKKSRKELPGNWHQDCWDASCCDLSLHYFLLHSMCIVGQCAQLYRIIA